MSCEFNKNLLVQYAENELYGKDREQVHIHIKECPSCQKELDQLLSLNELLNAQPMLNAPTSVSDSFKEQLDSEMAESVKYENQWSNLVSNISRVFRYPAFVQTAAICCLLLVGFFLGGHLNKESERQKSKSEINELKAEIDQLKHLSLVGSMSIVSPSKRMQAITDFSLKETISEETLNVFFKYLNEDENLNVRFASLQRISEFWQIPIVQERLLNALAKEENPLMQLSLMRMFIESGDQRVVPLLENILSSTSQPDYVQGYANQGLQQLTHKQTNHNII